MTKKGQNRCEWFNKSEYVSISPVQWQTDERKNIQNGRKKNVKSACKREIMENNVRVRTFDQFILLLLTFAVRNAILHCSKCLQTLNGCLHWITNSIWRKYNKFCPQKCVLEVSPRSQNTHIPILTFTIWINEFLVLLGPWTSTVFYILLVHFVTNFIFTQIYVKLSHLEMHSSHVIGKEWKGWHENREFVLFSDSTLKLETTQSCLITFVPTPSN